MTLRPVNRKVLASLVAAVALFASACGGGESAVETEDSTVEMTVEAAAESSVDLSNVEAQLSEVLDEVAALKSYFKKENDGSVWFTPATIPEITKDRQYGFALPLPSGLEATYTGITTSEASNAEGTLIAQAGGVSVLLLWRTDEVPLSPGESVVSSFQVLQQTTSLEFSLTSSGETGFTVDNQEASYATFVATDDETTKGIALIAGWTCGTSGRSFALTVSGVKRTAVTDSFFALAEGFECGTN